MTEMILLPVSSELNATFSISRGDKTTAETLIVELHAQGHVGRGECVPYSRYGENRDHVMAQLREIRPAIEAGLTRQALQSHMPAGAARCAIDCALWDLEAKQSDTPVWQLAGLPEPAPLRTAMTLSLDTPEIMANRARQMQASLLKLKLGGAEDIARIRAVHQARPDAQLILDGNEGMDPAGFSELCQMASQYGVIMIEQPFPEGQDETLITRPAVLSICADESAHSPQDVQQLAQKYDAINIKLDKTGGLTAALAMLHEARQCGLGVMIGCMVAGSLSMAPAVLLGQCADLVDLDGPVWLKQDVPHKLHFKDGYISPPDRALWG